MNVTLALKKAYETGRESGERQKSASWVRLVRALVLDAGGTDPKVFEKSHLLVEVFIVKSFLKISHKDLPVDRLIRGL